MKKIFKNIMILTMTIGMLVIVPIQKVHAGIFMVVGGTIGTAFDGGDDLEDIAVIGLGIVGVVAGIRIMKIIPGKWGNIGGALLLVLDADSSLKQQNLEQVFARLYPFIDDGQVITNLVKIVKEKAPIEIHQDQKYFVTLTEKETRSVLSPLDLTSEQMAKVVNDLK